MDELIGEWRILAWISRAAIRLVSLHSFIQRRQRIRPLPVCLPPPWTTRVFFAPWRSALERRCRVKDRRRCSSREDSSRSSSNSNQQLLRPPSGRRLQQRSRTTVQPSHCARLRRRARPCRRRRRDWCADRDDERRHCIRDPRRRPSSSRLQPQPAPPRLAPLSPLRLLGHTPTGARRRERVARCRCLSDRRRLISGAATSLVATTSSSSHTRSSRSRSRLRIRLRRICRRTLVRT